MSKLKVTIPPVAAGSYDIQIASGTLPKLWRQIDSDLPKLVKCRRFVITDSNVVSAGHLQKLIGKETGDTFIIEPAGEVSKNIDTVVSIIEKMENASLGRDTVIVALGGGTVGDIAGFAAAIFKRGIPVIQIPTTTVSQADSGVGGKTGVDSTVSKNAIGAFWQPAAVYIDVDTLLTLNDRQYKAGLIESVKHALISDAEYFAFFEKNMPALLSRDLDLLQQIAYKNCAIKADVVAGDPTEKNKRRILNFGHTIGHAVETASGFELLHGEAVAIGIVGAELIAQKIGLSDEKKLSRITKVLQSLDVPLKIPGNLDKNELIEIIKRDKKAVNRWPKFTLLEDIGKALCKGGHWAHEVSKELVEKTLDQLY